MSTVTAIRQGSENAADYGQILDGESGIGKLLSESSIGGEDGLFFKHQVFTIGLDILEDEINKVLEIVSADTVVAERGDSENLLEDTDNVRSWDTTHGFTDDLS